jgi:hypothetical protein
MQDKTNAELLQLILDATKELEIRRQLNEGGANKDAETDEGGDRPPNPPHFP